MAGIASNANFLSCVKVLINNFSPTKKANINTWPVSQYRPNTEQW